MHAHSTTGLFKVFAPVLYAFYATQMALIAMWRPSLHWNFARSVFAACTFNFGPHAITVPHLDFGNLAWGWCAVTALGFFDPDVGGHLILWDLKLRWYSFTQYTAGGLFRWIRNGYQTDEAFVESATPAELAARKAEGAQRWEAGVAMYSTVDSLSSA
ncbi:hypothetical protein B0H13DRAFT_2240245 [Mycena leptocephala]|nr:hypothetical protein B0H13DRAFT_2240245 [Mycena leptocephala]